MVPLPLKPKIIKQEKNKAVFEIEALYPGYGVTIGNSLRRVLLSSLPGAAITQMKIKGVQHEFSTIPGVLEDIISIMLNLKQLRFKVFAEEPQKATLKIKGGGEEDKSSSSPSSRKLDSVKEVKGSDFELPSQVELINKSAHVATLTAKSAELEMEILIEKGLGYQTRESRKKATPQEKLEIGVIPLDAIFTPVRKVAFRVENMRVGERTDFDRLFLEIETDGTILPEEAFNRANNILVSHFSLLADVFKEEEVMPAKIEPKQKKKKIAKPKKHAKAKKGKTTK